MKVTNLGEKRTAIMLYTIMGIILNILSYVDKKSIVTTGIFTVLWLLSLMILVFKDKFNLSEKTKMIIDTVSVVMFIISIVVIMFFDIPIMVALALLFIYSILSSLT